MRGLVERYKVDRRRVEAAHFQFATLQVASWYPEQFDVRKLPLHGCLQTTLTSVVTIYHGAFMTRYSGK